MKYKHPNTPSVWLPAAQSVLNPLATATGIFCSCSRCALSDHLLEQVSHFALELLKRCLVLAAFRWKANACTRRGFCQVFYNHTWCHLLFGSVTALPECYKIWPVCYTKILQHQVLYSKLFYRKTKFWQNRVVQRGKGGVGSISIASLMFLFGGRNESQGFNSFISTLVFAFSCHLLLFAH